jgi:hypothetical protein
LSRRAARAVLGGLGLDPRWLEAASGCAAVLWALVVFAMPGDLVDHPGYVAVGLFLPDWVWMTLGFAGGVAQLLGARGDHREARIPLAGVMAVLWGLVALGVLASAPYPPAVAPYGVLSAFDLLAMLVLVERWWRDRTSA